MGSKKSSSYSGVLTLYIWVLVVYLVVPSNILDDPAVILLRMKTGAVMAPDPVGRALKLSFLAVGCLLMFRKRALAMRLLKQVNPAFLVFLVLAPLSILWSIDGGATIARCISLMSMAFLGLGFCLVDWHRARFQSVFRPIITLLLVGSLIFGLVFPEKVVETDILLAGSWHGLTVQKNEFGMLASFGLIFWLQGWLSKEVKAWHAMLGGAASVACLVLSRSSTAMLASAFAMAFLVMLLRAPRGLRRYMPYIVGAFATIVILYAIAILKLVPGLDEILLKPVMAITGKDMTFSNRSVIWEIIKEHVQLRPLLGSGFGAYWTGPVPTSASYVFLGRMWFWPSQSHNGYLEITNDLGMVGLLCLIAYLIVFVRQGLRLLRLDRSQGALFLALFFQQAFNNLSESTWLIANVGFPLALMTFATFAMGRGLLDLKQSAAATAPAASRAPRPPSGGPALPARPASSGPRGSLR